MQNVGYGLGYGQPFMQIKDQIIDQIINIVFGLTEISTLRAKLVKLFMFACKFQRDWHKYI